MPPIHSPRTGLLAASALVVLLSGANLLAQGPVQTSDPVMESLEQIRADAIRATTFFLASDHLKGRATPSPGLDTAAAYLQARFAAAGLEPVEQDVEFQVSVPGNAGLAGTLRSAKGSVSLQDSSVAICLGGTTEQEQTFSESAVQFTTNADLGGVQTAGAGGTLLVSTEGDFAGHRRVGAMAARAGFSVVLLLTPSTPLGDRAFQEFVAASREPVRAGGRRRSASPPTLVLRGSAVERELGDLSRARGLQLDLTLGAAPAFVRTARNVGAILRGRDPNLADEFVMFTAHYDHIGWQPGGTGDTINNGADDDASGTAAVVALAEAYARLPEPPRRSLLFLCFCAEESGMVGSRAYAAAPLVPLEKTVADLNIEMIGRPEDLGPGRAWVTGYSLSEVGPMLAEAGQEIGFEVFEHPTLSSRLFQASDNISLARLGVPAHSISAGTLHADYHQVTDEPDRLDHANMERVIRALFLGSWHIAERDEPPAWSEGDNARAYREARGS